MTDTTETATAAVAAVADTETAAVLGGTETAAVSTENAAGESAAPVAKTPGKAARAARKNNGEKREYTPRGTTYWCRRVILLNGEPVGRGRPAAEGKGERKVVYVPVGMEYDVAVHGEGVKYNSHSHSATHKRIAKDSVNYTFDDGIEPTKAKTAKAGKSKAKTAKAGKTGKPAKTGKGKGKPAKKAKTGKGKKDSVTVPVADVPSADAAASVETAPAVTVPAATDAVTA